jgi:hypothetical protein
MSSEKEEPVPRLRRLLAGTLAACVASIALAAPPAHAEALNGYCDDGRPAGYEHALQGYAAYSVDGVYHNWFMFSAYFTSGFYTYINDNNDLDIWFHRNGVQMFHEWDHHVPGYQWYGWSANLWTLASDHEVTRWKGVFDLPWADDTDCNDWEET